MILLDTHIWIRWLEPSTDPLPSEISTLIDVSERVYVSAVSCWEVAYLAKRNRLTLPIPTEEWLKAALDESGVECLSINAKIATRAATLSDIHRDPADRFIIATAIETGLSLISMDRSFRDYPELSGKLIG